MQALGPAVGASASAGRRRSSRSRRTPRPARRCCWRRSATQAVHDFGNFDPRLFELRYDAPGAPALAPRVAAAARGGRHRARTALDQGGLDHGAWTALRYLFPDADVPVLPLAFVAERSAAGAVRARPQRWRRCAAEACWCSAAAASRTTCAGVLCRRRCAVDVDQPEIAESAAFRDWFAERSARSATGTRCSTTAGARRMRSTCTRPTSTCCRGSSPPAPVATGPTRRRRSGCTPASRYGALGMDAYAFGDRRGRAGRGIGRLNRGASRPAHRSAARLKVDSDPRTGPSGRHPAAAPASGNPAPARSAWPIRSIRPRYSTSSAPQIPASGQSMRGSSRRPMSVLASRRRGIRSRTRFSSCSRIASSLTELSRASIMRPRLWRCSASRSAPGGRCAHERRPRRDTGSTLSAGAPTSTSWRARCG